jgi:4-amino-4-deoxy-L-arabinose transferase-like glycosyltransferase
MGAGEPTPAPCFDVPRDNPASWKRHLPALSLAGTIGLFAFALRLNGLGDKPFWFDEVATLHRVTTNLPGLISSSLHADHYPSYFLLIWAVAKFGASQWLLRLPSAFFGALAASVTFAIGRGVAGWRAGAVAGLLMALSPFEVQFGQEARSYTLVTCLIMTALWGLVRLAQEPEAAATPLRAIGARHGAWLAYGLGTAAALDVLNVAIPWLIAANLGAIAIARRAGEKKRSFWRNWFWVQLCILAVWLPMLIAIYVARDGAVIDDVGWAWPATKQTIWSIIGPVYLFRISKFIVAGTAPAVIPALPLAIIAMVTAGAWHLRRNPAVLAVLGSAALILPLSLGLVSTVVPVLVPRYFVWGAGPFFVFAGAGLARLSGLRYAALTAPLVVTCLFSLKPYYGYETKPRWDLVAKQLAAVARPGDVVLVNSYYAYWILSSFAEGAGLDEAQVRVTWEIPKAVPPLPGHALWAVYGRTGPAIATTAQEFQASLSTLGPPLSEQAVGRFITLWQYRRSDLTASVHE